MRAKEGMNYQLYPQFKADSIDKELKLISEGYDFNSYLIYKSLSDSSYSRS